MTRPAGTPAQGAKIRASLNHPIIDSDGHVMESEFALLDTLKDVAGAKTAARFEEVVMKYAMHRWYGADRKARQDMRIARPSFWHVPAGNTKDRATAMLPGLMRHRLDEFGIDFMVVYTTLGLSFMHLGDDEMRQALCRSLNKLNAETFSEFKDRMTPAAIIPMHTPQEALAELDYAVNTLGMKAVTISGHEWRTIPKVLREAPEMARFAKYVDYLTLDSEFDYDPVWQKCIDLKVVPTSHVGTYGGPNHGSISNYNFNHAGHFAAGADMFCRSLLLGGVPHRFPQLKFAFLEGGVGWASMLHNSMVERFEKRNGQEIRRSLDPASADRAMMEELFQTYGGPILSPKAKLIRSGEGIMLGQQEDPDFIDDFLRTGAKTAEELSDQFTNSFYFGCEGEDRMTAVAFNAEYNMFDKQLNAMFSSDLGHWDVPEMAGVIDETWEMVEHGMVNQQDFRKFVFGNAARMYTAMNPDFFTGTVVERAVNEELHGNASKASFPKTSFASTHEVPKGHGAINAVMTRASALRLSEKAVDQADLDLILEAGLRAADHGRLRPWEFIVVRGEARDSLGKAFADGLAERAPSTDERGLRTEHAKTMRAPVIVVVAAKTKETANVPVIEQVVSAGGAAQNMLVAAHGLDLGGFWRTGSAAYSPAVKKALGLAEKDQIVGFLYMGHVEAAGKPRPADPAGVVREWKGA